MSKKADEIFYKSFFNNKTYDYFYEIKNSFPYNFGQYLSYVVKQHNVDSKFIESLCASFYKYLENSDISSLEDYEDEEVYDDIIEIHHIFISCDMDEKIRRLAAVLMWEYGVIFNHTTGLSLEDYKSFILEES